MPHPLLDPTSDFVFKILLVKNPDLLRDMIEAVLVPEVPIREFRILNPDIPKDFPGDKAIVLDVRVRLGDGSQIDLEMQSTVLGETPGRFLYYWARDFVDTMRTGDSYADLCPCVSILWFKKTILGGKRFHSVFHLSEDSTREVFSPLLELHVLELPKLTLATEERQARLERWARFFRAESAAELERLTAEDPIMSAAVDTLEKLSEDPDVQRQARDLEDARLMYRHAMLTATKKGRAEGKAEGKEEGLRIALHSLCRVLGLELDAPREAHLDALNASGLAALLEYVEQHRELPDGF